MVGLVEQKTNKTSVLQMKNNTANMSVSLPEII